MRSTAPVRPSPRNIKELQVVLLQIQERDGESRRAMKRSGIDPPRCSLESVSRKMRVPVEEVVGLARQQCSLLAIEVPVRHGDAFTCERDFPRPAETNAVNAANRAAQPRQIIVVIAEDEVARQPAASFDDVR